MNGIPPILYSEGPGGWSRIEKALISGGPVELIIPKGGSYDALRVGDHVLMLPKIIDIAEGSTLIIKLGEQGKLELVKIIPPVPISESAAAPLMGLDQIEPELMARLFEVLFEEMDAQSSESRLPLPSLSSIQANTKSQVLPDSLKLKPSELGNLKPLEKAIEFFLNQPESLAKLITTVRNKIIPLRDDEFIARLVGARGSDKIGSTEPAIDLVNLLKMPVEITEDAESKEGKLQPITTALEKSANSDSVLLRNIIKGMAIEIGEHGNSTASTASSILEVLKAAVAWFKDQSSLPSKSPIADVVSKLNALIEHHLNIDSIDLETARPLVDEVRLLAGMVLNDEVPSLRNFPSSHPKVFKVLDLVERFLSQIHESIESSQQDNIKKRTKALRPADEFSELPTVEIRNRLLEQCRVLERINTSLLLDGRVLFCLPFLVGGNPETVFGELRKGDNQDEKDSGGRVRKIRPDIRFEIDLRKLGHVLGLIFMKRKRISIFFEKEQSLKYCSGSLQLLSDQLGEGWKVEFDFKARHLNKNVTA